MSIEAVHIWYDCEDDECEYCQFLIEEGVITSCDLCGEAEYRDSEYMCPIGPNPKGQVFVYCLECVRNNRDFLMLQESRC